MTDPLGGYGSKYEPEAPDSDRPEAARPIIRYPISYWPRSNTRPNRNALPPVDALKGMELGARELPYPLSELQRFVGILQRRWTLWALVLLAVTIGVPIRAEIDWTIWSLGMWAVSGGVLLAIGHHPVEFWRAWLYTHPRLTPETRREHRRRHPLPGTPSVVWLVVVAGGGSVLPAVAPGLAGALFLGLAVVSLLWIAFSRLHVWRELVPLYLMYGASASGAAGVWIPDRSLGKRRRDVAVLVIVFSAVGATVSMRIPWERLLEVRSWTTLSFWPF